MNLRPRRREPLELGLTPLIDVVFLLLIFFMVTTTFRKEAEFDIALPEASRTPTEQTGQLTVQIGADGRYQLNDQPLAGTSLDVLRAALQSAIAGGDVSVLTIRADARTPHQSVVRVMDAAGQVGLHRIAIATVQPAP